MSSIQRDTPIQGFGRIEILRQSSNGKSKSFVGAKILDLCGEWFAQKDAKRHQTQPDPTKRIHELLHKIGRSALLSRSNSESKSPNDLLIVLRHSIRALFPPRLSVYIGA